MSLVSILFLTSTTMAVQFGYDGRDGRDGASAQNGRDGDSFHIYASGNPETLDLRGADAPEHAQNGSYGGDATSCYQPTENYNVYGANGGSGGDGGNGGRGGHGGDAVIFYGSQADLGQILIYNSGGRGSSGAYGDQGGRGCRCTHYRWSRRYCYNDTVCRNERICRPDTICRDVRSCRIVNGKEVCSIKKVCETKDLCRDERVCKDVRRCEDRHYSCQDGRDGMSGRNGSPGQTGSRGSIKIAKGIDAIPSESPSKTVSLLSLINNTVSLTKNIWEPKTGMLSLLARGSDVSNSYEEFVETAINTVSLEWLSDKNIEEFKDMSFSLNFNRTGYAQITINSQYLVKAKMVRTLDSHTRIIIEDIYKKTDVNQLTSDFSGEKEKIEITITDKAQLSLVVQNKIHLEFEVGQFIGMKTLFKGYVPADKMIVEAGKIVIKVGEIVSETKALKRGRKIRYSMTVNRAYSGSSVDVPLNIGKTEIK